jgi:hypothetical protein
MGLALLYVGSLEIEVTAPPEVPKNRPPRASVYLLARTLPDRKSAYFSPVSAFL